ncbi:MAG: hypothetical protein SVZ03_12185 [Spirochaetota bacterium]|nr:hypothetical protein [Spirochaetota bacterium]
MKSCIQSMSIVILFLCTIGTSITKADAKRVKSIEFKGLKLLSKYEIIDEVNMKVDEDYIVVDLESLHQILEEYPLIDRFNIAFESDRLIIHIVEKIPAFLLAIRERDKVMPFELDERYRIVSVNQIHDNNLPLIIISENDIIDGVLTQRLANFLTLLKKIRDNKLSLYYEMLEIDLTDFVRAKILLKGRKTTFTLTPLEESFYKLNSGVGYLDSIRYYPDTMQIYADSGLIK